MAGSGDDNWQFFDTFIHFSFFFWGFFWDLFWLSISWLAPLALIYTTIGLLLVVWHAFFSKLKVWSECYGTHSNFSSHQKSFIIAQPVFFDFFPPQFRIDASLARFLLTSICLQQQQQKEEKGTKIRFSSIGLSPLSELHYMHIKERPPKQPRGMFRSVHQRSTKNGGLTFFHFSRIKSSN